MVKTELPDGDRRAFLRTAGLGVVGLALGCVPEDPPDGITSCAFTPNQTEGPFWIPDVPVRTELDLHGDPGARLQFEGRVVGEDCGPFADAIVDLWHADPTGVYDDSATQKYRGQTRTDAEGRFAFHTVLPGHYEVSATWTRPAHLHVKVFVDGGEVLTTQLYFESDPFNDADTLIEDALIMEEEDLGDDTLRCRFDLVVPGARRA